jgi:ATP-dependent DNA helicase DinG
MAQAIGKTLESETGTLVVEAGTGVGKSLAYLIPAALWCVRNAKKILISTHTRALQEQLIHGDLPIVAKVLAEMGLPLKFAMLMGSDNYLCMQRLTRLRINPTHVSEEAREVLERLDHWGQSAKTGHRSHLPELVAQNLWDRISKDADICLRPSRPA